MLEIFALAYFIKQIKKICLNKGIKPTKWIITTVISWFSLEIIVFMVGFAVFNVEEDDMLILMLPAFLLAGLSAFIILERLKKEPGIESIDNIGKEIN